MSEELDKLRKEVWDLRGKLSEYKQNAQHQALVDAGWPPALIKAVNDPFDYAMKLKDGTTIFFEYVEPNGKHNEWVWVRLSDLHRGGDVYARSFNHTVKIGQDRGLEVRLSEIVWVADAPFGS